MKWSASLVGQTQVRPVTNIAIEAAESQAGATGSVSGGQAFKTNIAKGQQQSRKSPAWGKILFITLALAALGAAWRYTPLADYLTLDKINRVARVVKETRWAPIALVAAYTPAAVLMFPRPLLTLVAIIAFGLWAGIAYAAAGILLAALALYFAGRRMKYERIRRLAGERLEPVRGTRRDQPIEGAVDGLRGERRLAAQLVDDLVGRNGAARVAQSADDHPVLLLRRPAPHSFAGHT